MTSPKISVICPVYKAEKYLHRCVDSILAQTFTDFELLLVDDGSPDKSGEICDDYAAMDIRVRVFHKENGGVTTARKEGVDNATAEWITFIDSDDYIDTSYLDKFYNSSNGVDLVIASRYNKTVDSKTYVRMLLKGKIIHGPVTKLIRRSLFDNNPFAFPLGVSNGEDFIMNICLALKNTKKVTLVQIKEYNYIRLDSGLSKTFVQSMEYQQHFYTLLLSVFSKEEYICYLKELIIYRLNNLYFFIIESHTPFDHNSILYKDLLSDIDRISYKPTMFELLLMKVTSYKALSLICFIRRCIRCISRLLHFNPLPTSTINSGINS